MREITKEWVEKAEGDFNMAHLALYVGEVPITDGACFHSQQCAEKYLKAYLEERQIDFPRNHNLIPLLELCAEKDDSFLSLITDLQGLEGYAIAIRYPGVRVTFEMAEEAYHSVIRIRDFVRLKLR